MAKNEQPVFVRAPQVGQAEISVANANLDGTGTIVLVTAGSPEGSRITQIEIKAIAATTAGMVRLFLSFDGGVTWELWREVDVTAVTPAAAVQAFYAVIDLTATGEVPLDLEDGNLALGAATEQAEPFNVFARGGSFEA